MGLNMPTVDHVQEHRRGEEGLGREIHGEYLLRRGASGATEDIRGGELWWGRGIVYSSVSYD